MKYKKIGLFAASFALVASMFSGVILSPLASAAAQTCVWTGTAGDNKFSTPGNWTGCGGAAPLAGDVISFDASTASFANFDTSNNSGEYPLTNDLGVSLGGVTLVGKSAWGGANGIAVSSLSLTDGGVITFVADASDYKSFDLQIGLDQNPADLVGTGSVTITASGPMVNVPGLYYQGITGISNLSVIGKTATYPLIISQAASASFSPTNVVLNDATLKFGSTLADTTKTVNLDATNGSVGFFAMQPGADTLTFSGSVTLHTDMQVSISTGRTVKFTGGITGGTITKTVGSQGTLVVGAETIVPPEKTTTYSDSKPNESVNVAENETAILDAAGVRSSITVYQGGMLKGTGTLQNNLTVDQGAVVAPGNSPGCITSDTLGIYGEYQFELGGTDPCTGYDQLKVLNALDVAQPVQLGSESVVATSRYNGYTPKQGQVFTIINLAGNKAINGTFKSLPEGATFTQNGIVFKISYVGGDGNDVTLTVMNSPTAPDTGFLLLQSNPALVAIIVAAAAVAMVVLGRKLQSVKR